MRRGLGRVLMVFGVVLIPLGSYANFWLISMGCAMNTTGCSHSSAELFRTMIFGFWPFWITLLIAFGLIWLGWRLTGSTQNS